MLIEQTLDKLNAMKLGAMADAKHSPEQAHDRERRSRSRRHDPRLST